MGEHFRVIGLTYVIKILLQQGVQLELRNPRPYVPLPKLISTLCSLLARGMKLSFNGIVASAQEILVHRMLQQSRKAKSVSWDGLLLAHTIDRES